VSPASTKHDALQFTAQQSSLLVKMNAGRQFDMSRFPKKRPELPERFREIYAAHYRLNRDGATVATSMSKRMEHRAVARDVCTSSRPQSTLEIGAGTLNQLAYEPPTGPYDIVEPFTALFADSPALVRVRHGYTDISEVPVDASYDRITSIATFEHLCELPAVVAHTGLLLKAGGTLRVAVPSEGTVLWTLGWKLTTGLEYRMKYGLDYGILMRHEHVNTALEIERVLAHFYGSITRRLFGISRSLSFYQFFECTEPRTDLCHAALAPIA
jgi:hypothetical protein